MDADLQILSFLGVNQWRALTVAVRSNEGDTDVIHALLDFS